MEGKEHIDMNIEVHSRDNNIQVVQLAGRLAGDEATNTHVLLCQYLQTSNQIILDCNKLEYVDSSGLGILIDCLKLALSKKGDLRLTGIVKKVRMLMQITRADRVFKIYSTVDDALASFEIEPFRSEGV